MGAALNKESRDSLWCWIIGMTDLQVSQKTGVYDQDDDIHKCADEVQRLHPSLYNLDHQMAQFEDADENRNTLNAGEKEDLFKLVLTTSNKEQGTIMQEQELKLMLLRHWSLLESLQNSNYTVVTMKLWKEPGQKDLKNFLARLGIPMD